MNEIDEYREAIKIAVTTIKHVADCLNCDACQTLAKTTLLVLREHKVFNDETGDNYLDNKKPS